MRLDRFQQRLVAFADAFPVAPVEVRVVEVVVVAAPKLREGRLALRLHIAVEVRAERDLLRPFRIAELELPRLAVLHEHRSLALREHTQAGLAAARGDALRFLAVVAHRPHVALGHEGDGAVRRDGQITGRTLRRELANAPLDIGEINLDLHLVLGLLELEIRVRHPRGLRLEWQDVEAAAVAVALEEKEFAVRRPSGLRVRRVEPCHVLRLAARRRDDPDVPRLALALARVGNPLHVRRPREIPAARRAPVRARQVDHALRRAVRQREGEEAALAARDPKREVLAVRAQRQPRDFLRARPERLHRERGQIHFVDAGVELAVGGEIELLPVARPSEVGVVANPLRQPPRELLAAARDALGLLHRHRPNVAAQAERERLAVRR